MVSSISLPSDKSKSVRRHALIYFVCGNPGVIEYYTDFLTYLRGLLQTTEADTAYDIYGRNLLGFSDDDHEPFTRENPPWDLDGQIEGIYADVAQRYHVDGDGEKQQQQQQTPYDFVILMGHSVGAYISVEICHRHMKSPQHQPHLRLQHGFLLFPTLTHIAQSPRGVRIEFFRRLLPVVDGVAHVAAQFLLGLVPPAALRWTIEKVVGLTPGAAGITARWLKSRGAVWQAIHLGISELETIREERWEKELWEVAEESAGDAEEGTDTPKFFIFYGRDDHWVANQVRDDFIRKRAEHGERGGRTRITVDKGDIPHAFCTREETSFTIAKKVDEWIREIETNRVERC